MADAQKLSPEEVAALLAEENGQQIEPLTPEQVAELTGASPTPAPRPRQPVIRLPYMDKPSAALDTFALRGADAVPAGGMLTDLIGTAILRLAKARGVGEPGATLTPEAQKQLLRIELDEGRPLDEAAQGVIDQGNPLGDTADIYRRLRDTRRKDTVELSKENPWAGRIGEGVGTVASILAPLPGFKAGSEAGVLGRLAAAGKTGLAYGALSGFTNGESDLSRGDWRGTARDIVDNALGGGAMGVGVGALTEGASRAWPFLRRYAINKGREVLSGSSDMAAQARKPLSNDAAEEVLASGGIRAFDTTPQTHERVAQLAEEAGNLQGEIIRELESRGVPGPEVEPLAEDMMRRFAEEQKTSYYDDGPARVYQRVAQKMEQRAGGPTVPLGEAETAKRKLQALAKFHRRQASPKEESLQEASSMLRQAVEDAVERGAASSSDPDVRSFANAFVPAKQRTGRLLEAEEFSDRAAAKYLQKPNVSAFDRLTGAATSGGNPIVAEAQAQALSQARRRMPSALARYSYDLSHGMETGAVTPAISKAFALAFSPPITDTTAALLEYLKRKDDKK